MAGAGEALQGFVASVSGQSMQPPPFMQQCVGVTALVEEMQSEEYADCHESATESLQMMEWFAKKTFSNAAPGGKMRGITMETTKEEDTRFEALMDTTMKKACGKQQCMDLQLRATNVTMGCYLGGVCHMVKNMPDDDEDEPNPFKNVPESKCLEILKKGVMSDVVSATAMVCKKEDGPDGRACGKVLEVDFIANNPVCYGQMNGPIPQCTPSCKAVWTDMSKSYPVCSKTIENFVMHQKQNQLNLLKELFGNEMPVMEMPMITFTELCNRNAAAGSGSSMNVQI